MECINTGMEAKEAPLKGRPEALPEETPEWDTTVAVKADMGKSRIDLIPPQFIQEMGEVMRYGAYHYGDRNWEGGMRWGRMYAALQRHLNEWWAGAEKDSATRRSHLAHAACCAAILYQYEQRGIGKDDREDRHDTSDGR